MKPDILNEGLYKQLDLLYDSNYFASQLTNDPMGQLDPLTFIEGKEACWQSLSTSKIENKKALILTSWYFQYLDQDTRNALTQFFCDLMNEGFAVYLPEGEQLVKMTAETLRSSLSHFTPITTATARAMAAKKQLAHGQIDVINLQRLHALAQFLKENNIAPYSQEINEQDSNDYPRLPSGLTRKKIQQIEMLIVPSDKFSYVFNPQDKYLLRNKLTHQIHSLIINDASDINEDNLAIIDTQCGSVENLIIKTTNFTIEQLAALIIKIPYLTTIDISNSNPMGTSPLNLPEQLIHLKELKVYIPGFTIEQIVAILTKAPNITKINLSFCSGSTSINLPEPLSHLTELDLRSTSLNVEQLASILNKTPNLTKLAIDLYGSDLLINLLGQLAHLTELDVSRTNIDAEQLTAISTKLPKLTKLNISGCRDIDIDLYDTPFKLSAQLSHLTELDVSQSSLSAEQLTAILNKAPKLTKLNISRCRGLDSASLNLSEQLSDLIELDANESHLSAEQLASILIKAPNLTKINIAKCTKLDTTLMNLPRSLNHLRELNANNSNLTPTQFTSILAKTPNLATLIMYSCSELISVLLNQPGQLTHLTELSMGDTGSTSEQLTAIFTKAPNLSKIDISWNFELKSAFFNLPQLKHLTELKAAHTELSAEQVVSILAKTPNLKKLDITGSTKLGSVLFNLSEPLVHLRELIAIQSSLTAEQVNSLLINAPNLVKIDLISCSDLGSAPFNLPNKLESLTELNVGPSLTAEQFIAIFIKAPNLAKIDIAYGKRFVAELLNLPGQLDNLKEITLDSHDISPEQLIALRLKAPNLTKIDILHASSIGLSMHGTSLTTLSMPPIEPNKIAPDGNFSTGNNDLTFQQVFMSQSGDNPSPVDYHLQSYHWEKNGAFQKNMPLNLEPTPLPIERSLQAVKNAFATNPAFNTHDHFYGQIEPSALEPDQWVQLPALSPADQLLTYATDLEHCEIKRDTNTGYYYLKVDHAVSSGVINYIIESRPHPPTIPGDALPNLQALIATLQFNEEGILNDNDAFHQLTAYPKDELIKALAAFCYFPAFKAADISGTTLAIFNQLIQIRVGSCRHRAMLFVALATALGIKANLVTNDGHAFVVVSDEQHKAHTIDLGGAPGNVTEIQMDSFAIPAVAPTLTADNPFQTWNSLPLQAQNIPALAEELLAPSSLARHLIILKEGETAIEALHESVTQLDKTCFFTPNLDAMSLKTIKAGGANYEIVDNQLADFLHLAQKNPEKQFTWFINWSNPEAKHVGLNSIIDDKDRQLAGIKLPANLRIIAVMDSDSATQMGEDFYSRFDAISQVGEMSPAPTQTIEEINAPIVVHDALLTTPYDWENVLLGSYHINGRDIQFMPGALLKAMEGQLTSLRIHNAPWQNPKFRWFITELQHNRRFFANGSWHTLPATLHIDYGKPEFNYLDLPSPEPNAQEQEFILNPMTYATFFPHHRVTANGSIEMCPGVFQSPQAIKLLVTGEITEAQWYQLWQHAIASHCSITLQCAPNVAIPEGLKRWAIEPAFLKPKAPIALVVSNDLDYAEEPYQDAIHIPVSLTTRFETLFCHVHRQEQGFFSEDTVLLQALRAGKPIVFKGQFSAELAQRLQTLFTKTPSLYVNGENIPIKGQIVLLSEDSKPFAAIEPQTTTYDAEMDLQRLEEPLQQELRSLYQSLAITPCHSHFINLPTQKEKHAHWLQTLSQQLQLTAGQSIRTETATEPQEILNYLKNHPFVFLMSETGAGKSYFVQTVLPAYGKKIGREMTIHHGMDSLKAWLESPGDSFLFLDEVNLSAEHLNLLDNLAHGERVIWIEGQCYPVPPEKKIICAGNPKSYGGRFEADLFKRFPYYFEFKGQPLSLILEPLLQCFETRQALLPIIEDYYQQAMQAGLNITPRNAQMMCMTAFALKQLPLTQHMPEDFLMRYAALQEIQPLTANPTLTRIMRDELEKEAHWEPYKKAIDEALSPVLQKNEDFIWTESRQKIAMTIQLLLTIRDHKIQGKIDQATGINAVLLEGEAGLGKSRLLVDLLQAQQIPYVVISTGNPELTRRQLLEAFHEGKIAIIDEFNSFPDEQLLNALLSGVDLEGNPAKVPGFSAFCTQNPITYAGRQPLSKALANRLITLILNHYSPAELQYILEQKFKLHLQTAEQLTTQFTEARDYANTQKFFPQPNTRTIFKVAEKQDTAKRKSDTSQQEDVASQKRGKDESDKPPNIDPKV